MGLHHYTGTIEDQELIQACIDGRAEAQRTLYNRYVQAMYNRIVRMVADRHLAEDILQEVFLKVFRNLAEFRGTSTVGAWIKRIAVNTAVEHLRRERKIVYPQDLPEIGLPPQDMNEPATSGMNMALIHESIKRLPAGCRMVLTLYLLEGYRHREIAEILDITESTSKTQYRRGKQLLRQLLHDKMNKR